MDQFAEALKHVVAVVAAVAALVAPILKLFRERRGSRPQALEQRYQQLKAFFEDGGVSRHPLLVESGFAAAMGHTRFTAPEVAIALNQPRPTRFMEWYLRSRAYVEPTEDGRGVRLVSIAARERSRKVLIAFGVMLYAVFVAVGTGLLLFQVPLTLMGSEWSMSVRNGVIGAMCVAGGFACLQQAAQLHWASMLVDKQVWLTPHAGPVAAALSPEAVDNPVECCQKITQTPTSVNVIG